MNCIDGFNVNHKEMESKTSRQLYNTTVEWRRTELFRKRNNHFAEPTLNSAEIGALREIS